MLSAGREHVQLLAKVLAWPWRVLHVPPTGVTLLSVVPAVAAAYYLAQANWAAGLILGGVAAFMDMADGALARETGRITRFGGYLDSVLDRVVDLLLLFGIGFGLDSRAAWLLVFLASLFGYGTSYAKARAFEEVRAPPETWQSFFERPERLVVLALGVFGQTVATFKGLDWPVLLVALGVCAAGSSVAFVQRVLTVRRLLA